MVDDSTRTRVVVGVDGSGPSKRALQWAQLLATTAGAGIDAVAAWYIAPFAVSEGGWPTDFHPEAEAATMLHRMVIDVFGEHPSVPVRELVRQGPPAQVLLDASSDAQLLVVGSRGHGGFVGLLLGSVSTACAQHAACPVLVVHGDTPPPSSAT